MKEEETKSRWLDQESRNCSHQLCIKGDLKLTSPLIIPSREVNLCVVMKEGRIRIRIRIRLKKHKRYNWLKEVKVDE